MKEPRRIMSKEYPQTFQKLGDNSYYYNYDIQTAVIQEYDLVSSSALIKMWFKIASYST